MLTLPTKSESAGYCSVIVGPVAPQPPILQPFLLCHMFSFNNLIQHNYLYYIFALKAKEDDVSTCFLPRQFKIETTLTQVNIW